MLLTIILVIYWYIYPWYNISFYIFEYRIIMDYLIYLLLLFYILLQYRFLLKKTNNEFYHFFFWFVLIIISLILYLTIKQTFFGIPKDFLINTTYIKVQLHYSPAYMLYNFYKFIDDLYVLSASGEIQSLKELKDSLFVMQAFCTYDMMSIIKTIKELSIFKTFCLIYSSNILHDYKIIITYMEPENLTFITIRNLLAFLVTLKITCYAIPQIIFIDLPKKIIVYVLWKPYKSYVVQLLQETFNLQITDIQFMDMCQDLERWLLDNKNPIDLLIELIKYLLS